MLINLDEGLARVRGNKALYTRMLSMFIDSKEVLQLETFLAEGNVVDAAGAAHSIKGIAGNLSLSELFNISNTLTEELRKGIISDDTVASYRSTLTETQKAVNDVIATL